MKAELPNLYNSLCVLLNQDPLNTQADYAVSEKLKRKYSSFSHSRIKAKNIGWHWSLSVFVLGIFSVFFIHFIFEMFFISLLSIMVLWAGVAVASGLAHYKAVVRNNIMGLPVYIDYCVLGPTPVFIILMLLLNAAVPVEKGEVIRMPQIDYESKSKSSGVVVTYFYEISEGRYFKHRENIDEYSGGSLIDSDMHMHVFRGLFGYKVKGERRIFSLEGKEGEYVKSIR